MSDETKFGSTTEEILTCEVSDEALEAAAGLDNPRIFTLAFCTQDWNYCYPL